MNDFIRICFISITVTLFCFCSPLKKATSFSEDDYIHNGILEKHIYKCSVAGPRYKRMFVYLPPSYYSSIKSYPVIYFLHGANGNERSWIDNGDILFIIDSLRAVNAIGECICVFPNMNNYHNDYESANSYIHGSIDAYFSLNGMAEHSFVHDIMVYVDKKFRTRIKKEYRAICGLSIGGLQSLYISANYPHLFGHIGLFSPLIYPPLTLGHYTDVYKLIEDKLNIQFSFHPYRYMIMMGEKDIYLPSAYKFSEYLYKKGYQHQFQLTHGGHTWSNWKSYSISFMNSMWIDD